MPLAMELASSQSRQSLASTLNRARRKLIGRWRRLSRWEFWPPNLFYPPVVGYIVYLGIQVSKFDVVYSGESRDPGRWIRR